MAEIEIRYTTKQDSIPVKNKISLKRFIKIVWESSRTNLHYIDFCAVNEKALTHMFYPVRLKAKCHKCHEPMGNATEEEDDIPF